jgi:hypothetical protein
MIEAAYIAHTSACTGWDLDDILAGSIFKKSARTWRFSEKEKVQMLDWDFRRLESRGYDETWKRHLSLAQNHRFDVIMSPDFFHGEWLQAFQAYLTLKDHSSRVVMPIHVPPPDDVVVEIAWPMGVWTQDFTPIWEVQDQVTHLLGGSPHAQLKMAEYFPNLRTIDGNQAFWCAVRFGRYWDGRWTKPEPALSNEECFRLSVQNITNAWAEVRE